MRPEILFKLFAPNTTLQGIGPRSSSLIEKLTGKKIIDLLWLFPVNIITRSFFQNINGIPSGTIATFKVHVISHKSAYNRRQPYTVTCSIVDQKIDLIFFNARRDYLTKALPIGESRIVSGKIEQFRGKYQITHPDYIVKEHQLDTVCGVEAVYPLTSSLSGKVLRRSVSAALNLLPRLPEWIDFSMIEREGWNDWRLSLRNVHTPNTPEDLCQNSRARRRLAYDELLANQLALGLIRNKQRERGGRSIQGTHSLRTKVIENLPFDLTKNQCKVLKEIDCDLSSKNRMLRLLQGDVGSGKTIIAFLSLLSAIEAGFQAALMAPTEILARQHYESLKPLIDKLGIKIDVLTGTDRGKGRSKIIQNLKNGETNLIIGTHSLFQDQIEFKNLGYTVIDEQHKFGVNQRLALGDKGIGIDVLIMTATPIPRTLTMTAYGDLDISNLIETLPGRTPINTKAVPATRIQEIIKAVGRSVKTGARAYWICPLIENSENLDLITTEERYQNLKDLFGNRVSYVHGRMKSVEKDEVMERFRLGHIDILVATTVVEVGIDVPEATVIVIEHAERFGLAQLHQLRGRVGRGRQPSTCLLVYRTPLNEIARARIRTIRDSNDGFAIAEEDLKLRGSGELLGTRQSGLPALRIANLDTHFDLLETAKKDADFILEKDPFLKTERGIALRVLLYLFERDTAVQYLQSG